MATDLNEAASVKICELLIDMMELFGRQTDQGILLEVKVKQEVMGKLTGLHRVTVARELNKLKSEGLLVSGDGRYLIPDREGLLRYRDRKSGAEEKNGYRDR